MGTVTVLIAANSFGLPPKGRGCLERAAGGSRPALPKRSHVCPRTDSQHPVSAWPAVTQTEQLAAAANGEG